MHLNEELLSLREKNRVLSEENKELKKYLELLCEWIKKQEEEIQLFTFILMPGVEHTNNRAERALRPCVVQKKIWGCHRTEDGAKNRDILMSVIGTMKLQGKSILSSGKEHILKALA